MKKLTLLTLGLGLSLGAMATTTMPIVKNFDLATDSSLWDGVPLTSVPNALIEKVNIENPETAYEAPYDNQFFQNEMLSLCYDECDGNQQIKIKKNGNDYSIGLKKESGLSGVFNRSKNGRVIRQATVYYWADVLFGKLADLGFNPQSKLTIYVDRDIRDITTNSRIENNAFYMPTTNTLSFLPAKNTFLSKLLSGKLRPSGYDPTVVVHEAGHFVFQELTGGKNLNTEISGFNEGFADYLAMITLGSSGIGSVMLSGEILRDAEKPVDYTKKQEVHALGNAFSSALWKVRKLFTDKDLADKVVLDLAKKIGNNPMATAFDIPTFHQEIARDQGVDASIINEIPTLYADRKIEGTYQTANLDSLRNFKPSAQFLGVSTIIELPESTSNIWGLDREMKNEITLLDEVQLTDISSEESKYVAIRAKQNKDFAETDFWIIKEVETNNIVAAYDRLLNPVVMDNDFEQIKVINEGLDGIDKFKQIKNVENFIEIILGADVANMLARLDDIETSQVDIMINNSPVTATKHMANVKLKPLGRIANFLTGGMVRMIKSASFYVTTDTRYEGLLPKIEGKGYLLGYETNLRSGLTTKFLVNNVGLK